ncbi:MAG TPA: hypothetical protein VIM86_13175 [Thermodesulfobacteriota bacterium]
MRRINGLEVDQDLAFERKSWTVQRVGWGVMTLAVVAALAGLLGPGPASRATASTPDGAIAVEYDRFVRASAPAEIGVSVGRGAIQGGVVRLWVDRRYVAEVAFERIVPEPASVEVARDRLVYVFAAAAGATTGRIGFTARPRTFGRKTVRLGLDGGSEVVFGQFVYP